MMESSHLGFPSLFWQDWIVPKLCGGSWSPGWGVWDLILGGPRGVVHQG